MSADLIWAIAKDNHAFLVKRNGVQFSREKGNLTNKNSLKFTGLVPKKTIDISPAPKGVTITLKKKRASARKPAGLRSATTINTASTRTAAKAYKKLAAGYRNDLQKYALARLSRVISSQKPVKVTKPKTPRGVRK